MGTLVLADDACQRFAFMREMRVVKEGVKAEDKESERDAEIKGKVRQFGWSAHESA